MTVLNGAVQSQQAIRPCSSSYLDDVLIVMPRGISQDLSAFSETYKSLDLDRFRHAL